MPKASKVGKFRAAAKSSSRDVKASPLTAQYLSQKKDAVIGDEKRVLSKGQKKRAAKREQYLKREKLVMSSLRLQRLEEQKGKLDGLDAIREALGEALSPSSKSKDSEGQSDAKNSDKDRNVPCNTNKSKKTVGIAEITHMGRVLRHPAFDEDPFAAIQQHLRNSLAPEAERMKRESLKREEVDDCAEVKKREERKERARDVKFSKKGRGFKSKQSKKQKR